MLEGWLRDAIKRTGIGQAELARRLTETLGRSIDRAAVNKMLSGGRDIAADEMLSIAKITGQPLPGLTAVPLVAWVSAGKLADPGSQVAVEEEPPLVFAGLGAGDFFATRVKGDSMDRLSPEGSVIVVNRAERELLAGRCYIFSLRGETTFKRWNAEPPYLSPFSTNPEHQPIFIRKNRDFEVVGRVRRTVLDL